MPNEPLVADYKRNILNANFNKLHSVSAPGSMHILWNKI